MCPTGTNIRPLTPSDATSEYRRAFEVIDGDHDGKISGDDLRSFMASISGDIQEEEMIKAMISLADANKDGFVQYDEFERVLKQRKGRNGKEKVNGYSDGGVMEDVFRVMDQDGDGRLGLEDLKSYLGRAGIKVGDEEIKAMIKLGGGDVGEGVSFDGFVNILAVHDLVG